MDSGGVERKARICTPSFLTALTLITSGRNRITSEQDLVPPWMSQSTSSISPNLSGKASSNMLHLLIRIYVYICLPCQGKDAIKRVSYARDILNDGARYCCKLSPLLSGCPTHHCKSTAPLHKKWQELGLLLMGTAPSFFQKLPVPL